MRTFEKIDTVIIDDEKNIRDLLSDMLKKYCPEINIVGKADNVEEGISCIDKLKPELVFLDIALPDGTGFNITKECKFKDYEIVFVTAYNQYATKAFELSAIHYLLKPIRHSMLEEVVKRFKEKKGLSDMESRLKLLTQYFEKSDKRIMLTTMKEIKIVRIDDIIYVESEGSYTTFHTAGNLEFVTSKPLRSYYRILSSFGFCKIHTSYMVNLQHVRSYLKGRGGEIVMDNGATLKVSVRMKKQLINVLGDHLIGL